MKRKFWNWIRNETDAERTLVLNGKISDETWYGDEVKESIMNAEDEKIIREINAANPDFLWVDLGAPKQEIWMAEHKDKILAVMIGVGAGFDFHAGTVKRVPVWMQRCGLEWLYRLFQDPKRLWKRYVVTNSKFIWYMITGR